MCANVCLLGSACVFKVLNQDDSAEPSMRGHQWVFVDHSVNCRRNSEFFFSPREILIGCQELKNDESVFC